MSLTELNSDGDLGQLLKYPPDGDTRVVTRSARHEEQPPPTPDDRKIRLETTEHDGAAVKVDSTTHGVDDRFGLLVDLLLHKVVVLALHDFGELDLEGLDSSDGREAVVSAKTVDVEFYTSAHPTRLRYGQLTSLGNVRNVVILQVKHPLGVLNDSTGIASNEELDGLGHAVVRKESARLGSAQLAVRA